MNRDAITEFSKTLLEYNEKRIKLQMLYLELQAHNRQANMCLQDTIDNGFTSKDAILASIDFGKQDGFKSSNVKKIVDYAIDNGIGDANKQKDWYSTIDCVGIECAYARNYDYFDKTSEYSLSNPHVKVIFSNDDRTRSFHIDIPIKDATSCNANTWQCDTNGLYVVNGYVKMLAPKVYNGVISNLDLDNEKPFIIMHKRIAKCFDIRNIGVAIDNFMSKKYDEEIITEIFVPKREYYYYDSYKFDVWNSSSNNKDIYSYHEEDAVRNFIYNDEQINAIEFKRSQEITNIVTDIPEFMGIEKA